MHATPTRIVVKLGTGLLTSERGDALDDAQFRASRPRKSPPSSRVGHECLVVTSGAVGAGLMVLDLRERPADTPTIQACAAIGQSRLMHVYETHFATHGLAVAQLLLTHQDLDSRTRYANAQNTLNRLLEHRGIVPIINENDSVAVEELRFGDNDRLSAEVAILARADLLIVLTSAEGPDSLPANARRCAHSRWSRTWTRFSTLPAVKRAVCPPAAWVPSYRPSSAPWMRASRPSSPMAARRVCSNASCGANGSARVSRSRARRNMDLANEMLALGQRAQVGGACFKRV